MRKEPHINLLLVKEGDHYLIFEYPYLMYTAMSLFGAGVFLWVAFNTDNSELYDMAFNICGFTGFLIGSFYVYQKRAKLELNWGRKVIRFQDQSGAKDMDFESVSSIDIYDASTGDDANPKHYVRLILRNGKKLLLSKVMFGTYTSQEQDDLFAKVKVATGQAAPESLNWKTPKV